MISQPNNNELVEVTDLAVLGRLGYRPHDRRNLVLFSAVARQLPLHPDRICGPRSFLFSEHRGVPSVGVKCVSCEAEHSTSIYCQGYKRVALYLHLPIRLNIEHIHE
jgi:hypothetical protein